MTDQVSTDQVSRYWSLAIDLFFQCLVKIKILSQTSRLIWQLSQAKRKEDCIVALQKYS